MSTRLHRSRTGFVTAGMLATASVAFPLLSPPLASAEACSGWVYLAVGHNRVLAPATPLEVYGDCPELSYDATVQPYLNVGNRRITKLPPFRVTNVNMSVARRTFRIPRRHVRAAARYGAREGHRRAVLKFVIRGTIRETGDPFQSAHDNFFVLPKR